VRLKTRKLFKPDFFKFKKFRRFRRSKKTHLKKFIQSLLLKKRLKGIIGVKGFKSKKVHYQKKFSKRFKRFYRVKRRKKKLYFKRKKRNKFIVKKSFLKEKLKKKRKKKNLIFKNVVNRFMYKHKINPRKIGRKRVYRFNLKKIRRKRVYRFNLKKILFSKRKGHGFSRTRKIGFRRWNYKKKVKAPSFTLRFKQKRYFYRRKKKFTMRHLNTLIIKKRYKYQKKINTISFKRLIKHMI
jgi:hypothetical protein